MYTMCTKVKHNVTEHNVHNINNINNMVTDEENIRHGVFTGRIISPILSFFFSLSRYIVD